MAWHCRHRLVGVVAVPGFRELDAVKPTRVLNCAGLVSGVGVNPFVCTACRSHFWVSSCALKFLRIADLCRWPLWLGFAVAIDGARVVLLQQTGRPNVDWCEDHKEEVLRYVWWC